MSLIKRLWLALGWITLVAVLIAASINLVAAQRYLENELRIKNLDAATALALTISQSATDDITAGLLISSQFDLGHYRRIEFLSPDGKLALQRERITLPPGVPAWFQRLVPIQPEPGVALVQSGWKQLGTVRLQSDPSFAYESLWASVRALGGLFLAGCIILGILGTLFIRSIMQPLLLLVEQAQALAQRRHIEIKPPSTLEFRRIIEALNIHTRNTKKLLDEEARRLDLLKSENEHDALTGLLQRKVFLRHVQAQIQREDTPEYGCLMMVHLNNLEALNQSIGRLQVDGHIRRVVSLARLAMEAHAATVFGRLGARDIGILLPGHDDCASLELVLQSAFLRDESLGVLRIAMGGTVYGRGMAIADVLYTCDQNLTGRSDAAMKVAPALRTVIDWERVLDQAFAGAQWRLATYPVRAQDESLLFHDGFARIQSSLAGQELPAGAFLPWATRRGMVAEIDLEMLRLALDRADTQPQAVCVNLGYQAVCDELVVRRVIDLLRRHPASAAQVLLDIPESVAFEHYAAFERFCLLVRPLGCRIGIEHLDREIGHIGRLHGLGINHFKISATLTSALEKDVPAQGVLRGLCSVVHALGAQVIAEDVAKPSELPLLYALGFDGVSGPALS